MIAFSNLVNHEFYLQIAMNIRAAGTLKAREKQVSSPMQGTLLNSKSKLDLRSIRSSPRTGILSLIRFNLG